MTEANISVCCILRSVIVLEFGSIFQFFFNSSSKFSTSMYNESFFFSSFTSNSSSIKIRTKQSERRKKEQKNKNLNIMSYKAIHCVRFSSDPYEALALCDVKRTQPGDGEVLVKVHVCSVSFPETLIIQDKYQFHGTIPFSPGSEISGEVLAVGEGVEKIKVGDRVRSGMIMGGYREEVIVHESRCASLPRNLGYKDCFLGNYITSYFALKVRGCIKPGETVLVLGAAGGIGITSIQLAKALGASTVIACASSDEKLQACKSAGADHLIRYDQPKWHKHVKNIVGKGVDIIVDPVGDVFTEPAIRTIGWEGRLLIIGFAGGEIPKIRANLLLLKGASAVGVFHGAWSVYDPEAETKASAEILQMVSEGVLKPSVSRVYKLENAAEALDDMMKRKVIGKIVLSTRHHRTSTSNSKL